MFDGEVIVIDVTPPPPMAVQDGDPAWPARMAAEAAAEAAEAAADEATAARIGVAEISDAVIAYRNAIADDRTAIEGLRTAVASDRVAVAADRAEVEAKALYAAGVADTVTAVSSALDLTARQIVFDTVAHLEARPAAGLLHQQRAVTLGWYASQDNGARSWTWNAYSTQTPGNYVRRPVGHDGPGRWLAQGDAGVLSTRRFGLRADPNYDIGTGFDELWLAFRASETTPNLVSAALVVDPGAYCSTRSINWTGGGSTFSSWNAAVVAHSAYLIAKCAGKVAVDMVGARGINLWGLSIYGHPDHMPTAGLMVAPRAGDACGNNFFKGLKTEGYFSKAALANLGSETTHWDGCYLINDNPDPAAFAMIADGRHATGLTSDYAALRAPGTVASFSRNEHSICRYHKDGAGDAVLIDSAFGHRFRGGYALAYSGSNFRIRMTSAGRTSDLEIDMLAETASGTGVDYFMTLECADGVSSAVDGLRLRIGSPHASEALLPIVADAADTPMTSGGVALRGFSLDMNGRFGGNETMLFAPLAPGQYNPWTYVQGNVRAPAALLNLGVPLKCYLPEVVTDDVGLLFSEPRTGSAVHIHDRSAEYRVYGDERRYGDLVANGGPRAIRRTLGGLSVGQDVQWDDEIRNNGNLRIYRCVNGGAAVTSTALPTHSGANEIVTDANGIAWLHVGYQPTAAGANLTIDVRGPIVERKLRLVNTDDPSLPHRRINHGVGSPEGRVTGSPGDEYWDAAGPVRHWLKGSGAGTRTGWEPQPALLAFTKTVVQTVASTAEQELFSFALPPLSPDGELAFEFDGLRVGAAGTYTPRIKFGGSTILLGSAAATGVGLFMIRGLIYNSGGSNAQLGFCSISRGTDALLSHITGTTAKDASLSQTLSLTMQLANAADAMKLTRAKVTLLRP